jgi:predicted small secreted protein
VVPDGNGGWYIGGNFHHVGGQARRNLAHILANGDVSAWAPEPNSSVGVLVLRGSVIYVGGLFSTIGGQERALVAALDAETGQVTDWNAHAEGGFVTSIAIRGNTMYVGGGFSRMGGEPCSNLAALDLHSAAATGWRPTVLGSSPPVTAIVVDETTVYVGGGFRTVNGERRNGLAAIDRRTGTLQAWNPAPVSPTVDWHVSLPALVAAMEIRGNVLFVAGSFVKIGGEVREGLAAIDTKSGGVLPWSPAPAGWVSPYPNCFILALDQDVMYVGGEFTTMGGEKREWFAAVDARTGAVLPWNPRPNSEVWAIARSGETIYAGGFFTMLGNRQKRFCLAALDATTGEAKAWDAHLAGYQVQALAVHGSTLYVGGDFSEVGGLGRSNLAAFDLETGNPVPWSPAPSGAVWCLAPTDSVLYVGGLFGAIGGQERHRIAAVRLTDGTATDWNPNADDAVASLALGPLGVYAGGLFGRIGGETRSHSAALDPVTGAATPWDPQVHSWGWVNGIAVDGNTVYLGGNFIAVDGQPRRNLAAVDAVTDSVLPWRSDTDDINSEVESVVASGGIVFAGGLFHSIGGVSRSGLAALDGATGSVLDWNPMNDSAIWAMSPCDGTLYVGGDFASVWNEPQVEVAGIPMPTVVIRNVAAVRTASVSPFPASIEPNPSRTDAVIRFATPTPGDVKLVFYDVQGRQMTTIFDRTRVAAGPREVHVRTAEWPTGTYFCRLEGPNFSVTRKLVVLK